MMYLLPRIRPILLLFFLSGCKPTEESHMKAIIGAMLLDGSGGPPVSNSVVVVAGDRIRAAGASSTVPIPALADKIDGSGRFLVPAPIDIYPGKANESAKVTHVFDEGSMESAREAKLPIIAHIS